VVSPVPALETGAAGLKVVVEAGGSPLPGIVFGVLASETEVGEVGSLEFLEPG
jgi:hypothetical protein